MADQSEHDKNRLDNNGNGTYQLVTEKYTIYY